MFVTIGGSHCPPFVAKDVYPLNNISRTGSIVYIILVFPSWLPCLMILTPTCMGHSTHYHNLFSFSRTFSIIDHYSLNLSLFFSNMSLVHNNVHHIFTNLIVVSPTSFYSFSLSYSNINFGIS